MIVIFINVFIIFIMYFFSWKYYFWLELVDYFFVFFFFIEVIVKMWVFGIKVYFVSVWNCFDFIIVMGSLLMFFVFFFSILLDIFLLIVL